MVKGVMVVVACGRGVTVVMVVGCCAGGHCQ